LQTVLERELAAGCPDALVDGGLDGMLRVDARDEEPGSPLLRMIAALPAHGYASLDAEERHRWTRRALATIRREQTLERELKPARGRKRARSRSAGGPAASNGTPASDRTATKKRAPAASKIPPGAAALDLPIARAGTRLGGANIDRLERLGLLSVGDALRHYPYRHHDFSNVVPITELRPGEEQTIRGTVDRAREIRMGRGGRMRRAEVSVSDDSGASMRIVWFNQPFIARQLPVGAQIALSGAVAVYRGRPTLQNPEFEILNADGDANQKHTGRMVPVYRLTKGLPQRTLRNVVSGLLERFVDRIEDPLPDEIRERHGLMPLAEATRQVHYPDDQTRLAEARRRLAFDELLAIQVRVVGRKREWQEQGDAPEIVDHEAADGFLGGLPYALTGAQRRVLGELRSDLARSTPMSRLIEGDVGSGKTVVALAGMLAAVAAGYQAVLMAPTEVLAEQHFRTLTALLSGGPEPTLGGMVNVASIGQIRVVLLTGSTRAKDRRDAIDAIRHGGAHIIVGTHALIQDEIDYHRLGFAVVDEQHRFGVMQRGALREKGRASADWSGTPHLLVMTATPIPRSLALPLPGDLDLSVIDEMPPGRTPIETRWLQPAQRTEAFAALRTEVEAGRQAFVICPLVEGSETVISRAATEEYERLRTEEFPDLGERIALLHGRMSGRDKDAVMQQFAANERSILVSTAVVEVGIDIQNATVMVIEGADRFGLAQLHQFRGRVGRGEHASACYLLADDPTPEAQERLGVMQRTSDGFELAEADLKLRGPGEMYGTDQSGYGDMRVASLLDGRLIDAARREAEQLLEADPELKAVEHQKLRYAILESTEDVQAEMH
jgi:ATP-dependent DNA helicase RecG